MGLADWQASAMKLEPGEVESILTGDKTVGAWQVVAALIVYALRDDAISETQVEQALEAAVMALAMSSFGESMEALMETPDQEDAILS